MTTLYRTLRRLRVDNYNRYAFVPEGLLDAAITPQVVRTALEACQVNAWELEGI